MTEPTASEHRRNEERSERGGEPATWQRLAHVYWLGGGSGAGKSTIARRLADQYGLTLYPTDDVMTEHAGRTSADESPYLAEFAAMDMDERWVTRSPGAMLETFHWFQGEGFDLIVEDLLRLPADRGIVVEGFRLLPDLVLPLLAVPAQAVWLLPTPAFRLAAFDHRGSMWSIAGRTSDPERALANLLERDRRFTERLADQVSRLNLRAIEVDTAMTENDLAVRVADSFGL